ncbi:hypothetical protein E0H75_42400 [Kribbella capetownensis]|uniref:Uncharacterized protein n=1 Tax=Kribbella capetownensis TaxID=1572659 RepID=A0A4R0IRF1_9ACTN|nr:hypothetical protein [Kribbella capetownensis]TCC33908.1 hypothetical protein E0H75_42400 [Kribbella capetownensis]
MPTRTELAQIAINAKHDGATHVFVARSRRDDHHYAVPVRPGTDPHDIINTSRDPLLYCIALQHSNLSLRDQLTEHRPWHPEPSPGISKTSVVRLAPANPADRFRGITAEAGAPADADTRAALRLLALANARPAGDAARPPQFVTVEHLEAARRSVDSARDWTFSSANIRADYNQYESARSRLTDLTHAAYEQARIGSHNVHRITGLHREDVAPVLPATGRSSRQPPLGVPAVIGY